MEQFIQTLVTWFLIFLAIAVLKNILRGVGGKQNRDK